MAVDRGRNVIEMTADADAVTDDLVIQGLWATGAVAGIDETDDAPIGAFAGEGGLVFRRSLFVNGLKRGAGAGTLYVYLA